MSFRLDLRDFCAALYRHWIALVAGIAAFLVYVAQFIYHALTGSEAASAWAWLMVVAFACLFLASFRAWRDEHSTAKFVERVNDMQRPILVLEIDIQNAWRQRDRLEEEPFHLSNNGARDAVNIAFDPIRLDELTECRFEEISTLKTHDTAGIRDRTTKLTTDGGRELEPDRLPMQVADRLVHQRVRTAVPFLRWPIRVEYSDYLGNRFYTLSELEGRWPEIAIRVRFIRAGRVD